MKQNNIFLISIIIGLLFIIGSCKSEPVTTVKSIDGVSINFDNEGQGEPTIILVHGWSNTRSIWDTQIAHFSKKYQVIAVDLPGFGNSGNNRNEWTIESYAEDISAIIQQLNLKKTVLVGFSIGAPIVVEAANKVPDHVIGVILVEGIHEVEKRISPPMAHYVDSVMMDLVNYPTKEKLVGSGFFKNNVDSAFHRVASILEGVPHIGWRESLAGYVKWQNERCTTSVKNVKAPIIAINSTNEPTNVEAFRKYVPGFKVNIVENAGHLLMWDNPEEFNRLLEESIQEFKME